MTPADHPSAHERDTRWMRAALAQARAAAASDEVPVGAVVICGGQIIGHGANASIAQHDPTAHAEIIALRAAAQHLGNYRLHGCELYVTLEPCLMCAGAMLHARLKRVVFGAPDHKTGSAGSVLNVFALDAVNHQTQVAGGVLEGECALLLQDFFRTQRQRQAADKAQAGRALREDALRTSDSRFATLPDLPGPALYVHDLPSLNGLRLHYLDSGPCDGHDATVCLHGSADWSYAWRGAFMQANAHGQRVICLDLIGFGRSDKPKKMTLHSLSWHALYLAQLLDRLDLRRVRLVAPKEMQALVQHLLDLAGASITEVLYQQPEVLSSETLDAPFPDDGHRAALRAFSATVGSS